MGFWRNLIKAITGNTDPYRGMTAAQKDYYYFTGKLPHRLSKKEKKKARDDVDEFMRKSGYKPFIEVPRGARLRRVRRKRKKPLKVNESETVAQFYRYDK